MEVAGVQRIPRRASAMVVSRRSSSAILSRDNSAESVSSTFEPHPFKARKNSFKNKMGVFSHLGDSTHRIEQQSSSQFKLSGILDAHDANNNTKEIIPFKQRIKHAMPQNKLAALLPVVEMAVDIDKKIGIDNLCHVVHPNANPT